MNKDENIINYPNSIDTRVALLEMSIVNINETMKELKDNMKEVRTEIKELRNEMKSDFYKLLGIIAALGGIMAHGFHWF